MGLISISWISKSAAYSRLTVNIVERRRSSRYQLMISLISSVVISQRSASFGHCFPSQHAPTTSRLFHVYSSEKKLIEIKILFFLTIFLFFRIISPSTSRNTRRIIVLRRERQHDTFRTSRLSKFNLKNIYFIRETLYKG